MPVVINQPAEVDFCLLIGLLRSLRAAKNIIILIDVTEKSESLTILILNLVIDALMLRKVVTLISVFIIPVLKALK